MCVCLCVRESECVCERECVSVHVVVSLSLSLSLSPPLSLSLSSYVSCYCDKSLFLAIYHSGIFLAILIAILIKSDFDNSIPAILIKIARNIPL